MPARMPQRRPEQQRLLWQAGPVPLAALALLIPGHMFGWALEWVWLGLQLLFGTVVLLTNGRRLGETAGVPALVWAIVLTVVTLSGFLSAGHAQARLGIALSEEDLVDLVRLLLCIPLALHIGAALERQHVDRVVLLLKLCVLTNVVCSAILVLDLHPLSGVVLAVYEDAKVQYALNHIRIGIPFANPNFAALLFSLMLAVFLFFRKSRLFAALTVVSILLTGSRSGYLATAPLLLLAYLVFVAKGLVTWRGALALLAGHLMALVAFSSAADLVGGFSRVNELLGALQGGDLGQVNTASIRFEVIKNAQRYIGESPLLGVGPGRALGLNIVDSQIFSWPLNYGIPAAVLLYGVFLAPMTVLFYRAASPLHKLAAVATALSFFLMLGTGDFMKNFRLFYIVILLMHVMHLVATPAHRGRTGYAAQPST